MVGGRSTNVSVVSRERIDSPRVTSSSYGSDLSSLMPSTLARPWPVFVLVDAIGARQLACMWPQEEAASRTEGAWWT